MRLRHSAPLRSAFLAASGFVLLSCSGGGSGPNPIPPADAPTVTSIIPNSGAPGTAVTLSGTHLDTVTAVAFNGVPATLGARSATQLSTTVPNGASSGPVTVTGPSGTATAPGSFTVTTNAAPSTPVIVGPTNAVTLHPYTYNLSATDPEGDQITFVVSGAATATVGPTTGSGSFIWTPASSQTGSQTISVIAQDSGTTRNSSPAMLAVSVAADRPPQFISSATGQLAGSTNAIAWNTFQVNAQDPDGDDVRYSVSNASFLDNHGGSAGINGAVSIHPTTGLVNFTGTVPPGATSVSATFTVTATDQLVGSGTVLGATATQVVTLNYFFGAMAPVLTGFNPTTGPVGTHVVLTGSGFTGATTVAFNNVPAAFTVDSATQITATVPSTTTGPIRVVTPGGTATSATNFTVTPSGGAPTITGFNPASGLPGQAIQILGANLGDATAVTFQGTAAAFLVEDGSTITALVPSAAASGTVSVTTPGGTATSPGAFTVTAYPSNQQTNSTAAPIPDATGSSNGAPVFVSFTIPDLGYPVKSVQVALHITHTYVGDLDLQLIAPDGTPVLLEGSRNDAGHDYGTGCGASQWTVFSDSAPGPLSGGAPYVGTYRPVEALAKLAGHPTAGTWQLRIQDQGPGDVGTFLCGALTVTAGPMPPAITGFNPTMGPAGTTVLLTGTRLGTASSVTIGNVPATGLSNITATSLQFNVPAGAPTGPVRVVASAGTAISSKTFTPTSGGPTGDLFIDGAYVTQSAQNYGGSVPLVAGKDGLLRIFPRANQGGMPAPSVRVRTYNGATLAATTVLPPVGANAPTSVSEGSLSTSWNYALPGSVIQPGVGLLVDVDPSNVIPEADETNNTWPASGVPAALDVRTLQAFHGTLIPVTQSGLTGNANAGNLASWYAKFQKMYPIAPAMDVVLGATYTTSQVLTSLGGGWSPLLTELEAKRVAEASTRYYYGALNVSYGSGVAGLGYVPSPGTSAPRSAMGWDKTSGYADGGLYFDVLTHETGHNMGRAHSPCGGAAGPDPAYPYPGALIGIWGLDVSANALKDPSVYTDIMAYCSPVWVSDYVYSSILSFRQASPFGLPPSGSSEPDAAVRAPEDCLLVMGRIQNGTVELDPALRLTTVPTETAGKSFQGSRLLEGRDASGAVLFRRAVPLLPVADDLPGQDVQHFVAAIPVRELGADNLRELRVLGDSGVEAVRWSSGALPLRSGAARMPGARVQGEGEARLQWDSAAHPLVMVRDPRTGEVLSFARGGDVLLRTTAPQLELTLSDGTACEKTLLAVTQ